MVITNSRIKLLKTLLASPKETYTIRALSKKAGINYRQAYEEAIKMNKDNLISIAKQGNSSICSINLQTDTALYAYVESLRTRDFIKNSNKIQLVAKELEKISTSFCTAILFGSHAKGKATKDSDIDILLVSKNPEETEQEANAALSTLSYNMHISSVSEESFNEMRQKKGLNVVNELEGSHIILAGYEDYCRLMAK